jgi:hypothetical protein
VLVLAASLARLGRMTIVTLAIRQADHIASEMAKGTL